MVGGEGWGRGWERGRCVDRENVIRTGSGRLSQFGGGSIL